MVCAKTGNDSETAKNNFIKNIEKLGGKVVGEYKGNSIGVECVCKNGHPCTPSPGSIRQGSGMCKICAGNDSETAKQNFIKNIEKLGGKVVGEYKGNSIGVECVCKNGHPCTPSPGSIRQGCGMCSQCTRKTEAKFYEHYLPKYPDMISQYKTDWCRSETSGREYPYDFCFPSLNILIEIDGPQHYRQVSNWQDPAIQNDRDKYKIKCALNNGYTIIHMCQEEIYDDTYDWVLELDKELYIRESPEFIMCTENSHIHLALA